MLLVVDADTYTATIKPLHVKQRYDGINCLVCIYSGYCLMVHMYFTFHKEEYNPNPTATTHVILSVHVHDRLNVILNVNFNVNLTVESSICF